VQIFVLGHTCTYISYPLGVHNTHGYYRYHLYSSTVIYIWRVTDRKNVCLCVRDHTAETTVLHYYIIIIITTITIIMWALYTSAPQCDDSIQHDNVII